MRSQFVSGVDIWRHVVQHLAGGRRVDVHGIDPEPLRHLAGPVRGGHQAYNLPQHNVPLEGQDADRRPLGAQLRHLLSSAGRVEGRQCGGEESRELPLLSNIPTHE